MEKVYDVDGFRASANFKTDEYFKKFRQICSSEETTTAGIFYFIMGETIVNQLGVDYAQLEILCHVENLKLSNEPDHLPADVPEKLLTRTKICYVLPICEEARQLNIIRTKEALDLIRTTPEFKFGGKRFLKCTVTGTADLDGRQEIIPYSEFIYSIIIYKPCSIYHGQRNSSEKLRFAFEIEALGSNLISDVVDIIDCVSNSLIIREVENTSVNLTEFKNAKKWYSSQTVFIDGVFYNDTRSPEAIDLSPKVIEWAKEKNIGTFTIDKMQEVILSSLTPRLGYPYVYIHQGDCEHIFVFTDARLSQSRDGLSAEKYPRIGSFSRTCNIMCIICTSRVSQWMVVKCDRFPQEKVFVCTECCNSYLYINDEKVTDFKLYPLFEQKIC